MNINFELIDDHYLNDEYIFIELLNKNHKTNDKIINKNKNNNNNNNFINYLKILYNIILNNAYNLYKRLF